MTPIMMSAASGHGSASWIATVESIANAKPKPIVRAFSRQGAGRSEMLADIAPSVAGWPAAKPKTAEATSATAITPSADAHAVDDVLADKEPQEIWRARPAKHEPGRVLGGRRSLFQRLDRARRDRR